MDAKEAALDDAAVARMSSKSKLGCREKRKKDVGVSFRSTSRRFLSVNLQPPPSELFIPSQLASQQDVTISQKPSNAKLKSGERVR